MNVTKRYYRAGTSYAIGTIIDGYLSEKDCQTLYEKWESDWPEPLAFQGNQKAITARMILEVPFERLVAVYKKTLAKRLLEVAQRNVEYP
jgi:hypothetical protein